MKIAQLTSNYHSTLANSKQAIYSHVSWLTDSLVNLGHEVTLFAAGDSKTKASLVSVNEANIAKQNLSENITRSYVQLLIAKCYLQSEKFDIIHSHQNNFSIIRSLCAAMTKTPTVHSLHSPIKEEFKPFLLPFRTNNYVSFSLAQRKAMPELNWVGNIYHGVDTKIFSFNPKPEDYFLFLGRITEEKGVHFAIKAAKTAGVPLIIAGKSYPTEGYWHKKIEKYIDGKNIRYVGETDFKAKIELLKNAKAVLFPTQYDEVFGLVMIEAMACGTPVIGWDKGSVPEIINHGKTGFVIKSVAEMTRAIKVIETISREDTRKRAELYFSIKKMVEGYTKIYTKIIEEKKYKKKNH